MKTVKQGDIFLASLPDLKGSIQNGYRPVIVVQNNIGNKNSPVVIVVPITSRYMKKAYFPMHVSLEGTRCLQKVSMALCEQVMTISKDQLGKYIGTLKARKLREVKNAVVRNFTI